MAFRFLAPCDRPFAEPREVVSSSSCFVAFSSWVFSVSVLHARFLQAPPLVWWPWLLSQFISVAQLVAQPVSLVAVATPASLAEAEQVGM